MFTIKNGRLYPDVTPERLSFALPDGFLLVSAPGTTNDHSLDFMTSDRQVSVNIRLTSLNPGETLDERVRGIENRFTSPWLFQCQGHMGKWAGARNTQSTRFEFFLNIKDLELADCHNATYNLVCLSIMIPKPMKYNDFSAKYHFKRYFEQLLVIE